MDKLMKFTKLTAYILFIIAVIFWLFVDSHKPNSSTRYQRLESDVAADFDRLRDGAHRVSGNVEGKISDAYERVKDVFQEQL